MTRSMTSICRYKKIVNYLCPFQISHLIFDGNRERYAGGCRSLSTENRNERDSERNES
jgi:hypothetical protein